MWWVQIALAILTPILAYAGLTAEEITTWETLGELLLSALKNPYVLTLVGASVYNAIVDPTTKGIGDSDRALEYTVPGGTEEEKAQG